MPYLVTGNAQQIFHAFGQNWAVAEGKDDIGTIRLDFPRTHFLGTPEEAIKHFNIWNTKALGQYYLQGNMSAGNLHYLLGSNPLMKENEDPESYNSNFIRQHFAYMSDKGEPCGLMVMYRKDNPKQWIMGLVKKGHAAPKDRELIFLSSFDLTPFISVSDQKEPTPSSAPFSKVTVSSVDFLDNPLTQRIDADLPKGLLKDAINAETGELNLRFQRVELMTRKLQVEQETATLSDPVPFSELNLSALFADNRALDLIIQYNFANLFPLSSTLLRDLLSESSPLRKEIESIKLTEDENRNKNLLKIVLVFYKYGLLEKNRHLLNDPVLMQKFGSLMGSEAQIKLIPFLKQKKYSDELIHLILSEPAYFKAINMLVDLEPALTENVPQFFKKDAKKLEDLKFIHSLSNDDTKRLCLLFWVKENLSEDGYQQIITATNRYPLLASTLVALDQTKTKTIHQLQALAVNPEQHLRKSILYHFREELNTFHGISANLHKLSLQDLEAASESLILLKKLKITDPKCYRLVVDKGSKGHALRLLLPQLATIKNEEHQKLLIEILFVGAKFNIESQDKRVRAIKDQEPLKELAITLHECFKCVMQLQDFMFDREVVEFAAQKDSEEARRFRHIILCILEQCKVVDGRLSGSKSHREMFLKWDQEEKNYRKALYQIAYDGLTKSNVNIRAQLQEAENKILAIVDPEIESDIYKALIVFANIIITVLSFCFANVIKYKATGNCWFFNQTRSGEELRALDREIVDVIAPEKNDEVGACGVLSFC
ncbi:hypothetical protein Lgra_1324 [Legionella gratiana]|uniref:Uncharacterized protein n=1 Tax=Legionella gratiana TaxID=45066 RepID=A0A378JFJ1_9GAMM|nr:hypothetical protein [Legionella gratiana]KTD11866.1 hypothetical protein Lgra_1324 [Legionella gratiana]STX46542.1 Uncharacterised protein [Legionella gratiana]